MGFFDAIRSAFSKYASFEGRARRSEYWYFYLFTTLVNMAAQVVGIALNTQLLPVILMCLILVGILLPSLAVSVRRLHDVDRSGWFILIAFVPVIGGIVLLIWSCSRGTIGVNRFGPDPIDVGA
ncbi:DUF805 domain-containing protein [Burkholderia pyrrocinia]|uniref:DUF805 domain-containing protein n=1 Tax=Burkholderia pyrrocinia TaxID=60550 RepID=UPI00158EAA39|nr:DUF805 domain-containing protein [Burkholderia pyrrocinia]